MLLTATLRLLTFDLDDTLFPCGDVVKRANGALAHGLTLHGAPGHDHATIQHEMKVLRKTLDPPFSYSDLRKVAISSLVSKGSMADDADGDVAERLFNVWLDERQAAADALLFPGCVDARRKPDDHPDVVIGSITQRPRRHGYCRPSRRILIFRVSVGTSRPCFQTANRLLASMSTLSLGRPRSTRDHIQQSWRVTFAMMCGRGGSTSVTLW